MRNLIVLTFLLITFLSVQAQSDNYHIENYTVEHGLPNPYIKTISEDTSQFLWIGSSNGLSRYDGINFVNHMYDVDNPNSLPAAEVKRILIDKKNNVWAQGANFVARLNECNGEFDIQIHPYYLSKKNIKAWEISEKRLIVMNADSCSIFDPIDAQKNQIIIQFPIDSLSYSDVTYLIQDANKKIWIGTKQGLFSGKLENNIIILSQTYFNESVFDHHIQYLFETHRGEIIATSDKGIMVNTDGAKEFTFFEGFTWTYGSFNGLILGHLSQDQENKLWIVNNYFIWIYKIVDGKWTNVDRIQLDATLNHVYHDTANNHWVSGRKGVFKLLEKPPNFTPHIIDSEDLEGANNELVFGVDVDSSGAIWTCGWGLYKKEKNAKKFTRIFKFKGNDSQLSFHEFYGMYRDNDQNLWLSTIKDGVIKISNNHQIYEQIKFDHHDKYPYRNEYIKQIQFDQDNDAWITRRGGVSIIKNNDNNNQIHFELEKKPREITFIDIDSDQVAWVGGYTNKIYRIEKKSGTIDTIVLDDANHFSCLLSDKNGKDIWIATNGGGIWKLDKETLKVNTKYTKKEGLLENSIYGIEQDDSGNLWLPVDRAIVKFNPITEEFTNYTKNDGLPFDRFVQNATYKDKACYIWFCTDADAVIRIHPDSMQKNDLDYHQPVILENISVFDQNQCFPQPVKNLKKFSINSDSNFIAFDFIYPEHARLKNILYSYKLEGWDKDWSSPSTSNHVSYANLDPANYTFKVKATGTGEVWSNQQLNLAVEVIPQLHEKLWFKILLWILGILALLVISYYFYKRRVKQLNDNTYYAKLEALRSQLNHHFIFNTLNSVNSFIARGDKLEMNNSLGRLAKLIRTLIDHSKSTWVSLDDEIQFLENYMELEKVRFGDRFQFDFNNELSVPARNLQIPPMLIQPFLENAVNHAFPNSNQTGLITLTLTEIKGYLKVSISDNGEGYLKVKNNRKKQLHNTHKSIGIVNVRSIISNLNQLLGKKGTLDIIDKSTIDTNEKGTLVKLLIPTSIVTKSTTYTETTTIKNIESNLSE